MLIFWRIHFEGDGYGYLVFRDDLNNMVGIYDDNGNAVTSNIEYTTQDTGTNPLEGVTPPAWAGSINA